MGKKFYTPDGFTDSLPGITLFKKNAEAKLRTLFAHHGYSEIETPGLEYLDVYVANDLVREEELFKLVDQKGRLLCLRYDGTIPAARFLSNMKKEIVAPIRLSYIENMYRYGDMGGGKMSGFTQGGVELMGASGSNSDGEVIALAIKSALEVGIKDLQISLGQVGIYNGFINQLGINIEEAAAIREAISNKDIVAIERLSSELKISDNDKETLLMLPMLEGTYDVIDTLNKRIEDKTAIDALTNIKEILDVLDDYGFLKYVTFDPSLIGSEDYYTGVVFKGYTYEVGFPIISGGRYDNTLTNFGKELECVGFSISLTLAITALLRQGVAMEEEKAEALVGFDSNIKGARARALSLADGMRERGLKVIFEPSFNTEEELDKYGEAMGIESIIFIGEDTSDVDPLEYKEGEC